MKKRTLYLFALLLAAIGFFSWLFLDHARSYTTTVNAPFELVTAQLKDPNKLAGWLFTSCDSCLNNEVILIKDGFTIKNKYESWNMTEVGGGRFLLEQPGKPISLLIMKPASADARKTTVEWIEHRTGWQKISGLTPSMAAIFFSHLTSNKALYGFPINETSVVDTTFLLQTKIVARSHRIPSLYQLYNNLEHFASMKELNFHQVRILFEEPAGNDSIKLMAAISVHGPFTDKPFDTIQFRQMPYKKKLLEASFTGHWNDLPRLATAMDDYCRDHGLVNLARPFIRFENGRLPTTDTEKINVTMVYPVY